MRRDVIAEMGRVASVDVARKLQRLARAPRQLDRPFGPLLIGHAAQKGERIAGTRSRPIASGIEAVMNDAPKVGGRNALGLIGGDGRDGQVGKGLEEELPVQLIATPMHGRQRARANLVKHGGVRELGVEVDRIEAIRVPANAIEKRRFQNGKRRSGHTAMFPLQARNRHGRPLNGAADRGVQRSE